MTGITYSATLLDGNPFSELAQEYLTLLLNNERHAAGKLILDAVEGGVSVQDIYIHVFQRSQHEIGWLWQTNQVNVAQEHFCTAATQLVMSQLYPYIFSTEKTGRCLVATCVGGEQHEIGVRMVADFFEMAGWDTYYLGANTPAKSIIETIESHSADILAISATITFNIGATTELISQVKSSTAGKGAKILVGGRPFIISSNLWQKVGADGFAVDANEAINTAEALLN